MPDLPAPDPDLAQLLLAAARHLGETLEPARVYDRFHELLAGTVHHDGVVVSSYDEADGLIRCEYAWVDGEKPDPGGFPPLPLNREGGGMQSRVILSGEPLLANDVRERVRESGTYYDVDARGHMRRVPEEGEPLARAAMMVPVRHEGRVVGVVQLMSDGAPYEQRHLEIVEGLVGQMAAAIRNARLAEERSRLQAAEAAARAAAEEREQAAHVLEALGDGVAAIAADGTVRLWNASAGRITGLVDAVGANVRELVSGWDLVEREVPVSAAGAPVRPVTLPLEVQGRELWLSFVAVRSGGAVVYAFRDLTAERLLEQARSDFLATVSHELRTPVAAVLGAARTLLRTDVELDERRRRDLLEMIASQGERLAQVTEDVLLANRLDRDELELDRAVVDVDETARETVEALRPRLPEGVALELRAGGAGAVVADADRVRQVLASLIDNAAKYSPGGGDVVVATARDGGTVRVTVADAGIGIAPGEHRRIFEKFYRVDPQLTESPGGAGLGLYIARELVRRMGGRILVESDSGSGATFTVELPAERRGPVTSAG